MRVDMTAGMPTLIVDVQITGTWRVGLALRLLRVAAWLMRGKLLISTQEGVKVFKPVEIEVEETGGFQGK